jgi:hypothetical protein
MYTRTKLMKRVEVVKVPTYKWVVEEVPCDCGEPYDCGEACGFDEVVATDAPTPKVMERLGPRVASKFPPARE